MTNEQIIFSESVRLMNEGVIASTGRIATTDAEGNEMYVDIPEPIHTYAAWKKFGYQVKHGEKAIAQFLIWKHSVKFIETDDGEKDVSRMFMKKASFFKGSQVERIREEA